MDAIHTETRSGYTIKIIQDSDPQSPREDDNLGTMACFHSRYNLGDKHNFDDGQAVMDHVEKTGAISMPLFLYDHSGITMNTTGSSCPWDSGQVGIIFVEREKILKEYGWKKITRAREKKICEYLKGEVQQYDDFLTGNIYGFDIEDSAGNSIDSCWGFFGDYDDKNGCLDEARSALACHIVYENKKKLEKVKTWIKNRVPLQNRVMAIA